MPNDHLDDFNTETWIDASSIDIIQDIRDTPHLWLEDTSLKYLTLRIDTRDGNFRLFDRNGKSVSIERVREAYGKALKRNIP